MSKEEEEEEKGEEEEEESNLCCCYHKKFSSGARNPETPPRKSWKGNGPYVIDMRPTGRLLYIQRYLCITYLHFLFLTGKTVYTFLKNVFMFFKVF